MPTPQRLATCTSHWGEFLPTQTRRRKDTLPHRDMAWRSYPCDDDFSPGSPGGRPVGATAIRGGASVVVTSAGDLLDVQGVLLPYWRSEHLLGNLLALVHRRGEEIAQHGLRDGLRIELVGSFGRLRVKRRYHLGIAARCVDKRTQVRCRGCDPHPNGQTQRHTPEHDSNFRRLHFRLPSELSPLGGAGILPATTVASRSRVPRGFSYSIYGLRHRPCAQYGFARFNSGDAHETRWVTSCRMGRTRRAWLSRKQIWSHPTTRSTPHG